jgi:hypothetical protein
VWEGGVVRLLPIPIYMSDLFLDVKSQPILFLYFSIIVRKVYMNHPNTRTTIEAPIRAIFNPDFHGMNN